MKLRFLAISDTHWAKTALYFLSPMAASIVSCSISSSDPLAASSLRLFQVADLFWRARRTWLRRICI